MFSDGNYSLIHLSLNVQGNTKDIIWNYNKNNWKVVWKALQSEYDVYGKCGGSCNSQSSPICSCLLGFKPNNTEEWNRRNWTSGCVRSTPLQCERVATDGEIGKMDGFLTLNMMKVPDSADSSSVLEPDCKQQCLQNCSCTAYAFNIGTGCLSWTGSLLTHRNSLALELISTFMLPIQNLVSCFVFQLQPNPHNTSTPQSNEILVKYNLHDQNK